MNQNSGIQVQPSLLELAARHEVPAGVAVIDSNDHQSASEKVQDSALEAQTNASTAVKSCYSIFSKQERLAIVLLAAFAAIFSPLSSNLYFPTLTAVAHDLHATLSKINLTITSYMIVSGFAPMFLCSAADHIGRRPIYICMFATYSLACLGAALQKSYPALLVLRMLQSAGGSATIGLGYGIVGDLTESSDRGTFIGILCAGPNVAPSIGPVLGGAISQTAGWRWTFGLLAISGCLTLLAVAIFLPETARNVVGNGSLPLPGWKQSLLRSWVERREKQSKPRNDKPTTGHALWRTKLKAPILFESFSICFRRDTAPIILLNGVTYAEMNCLQASLSSAFIKIYGYTQLEAGLIYLPFGVGCFIATLLSSKMLSKDYRDLALRHHLPPSSADTTDEQKLIFPLFHARLRRMVYLLPLSILPLIVYGWFIQYRLHPSVPLILTFFLGGSMTIIFNACGTLIIDLHPTRPSTAQASLNIVRCSLAAAFLAVLQPLANAIGDGWCFTVLAIATGGTGVICVWIGRNFGEGWRRRRQSK